VVADDTAGIAGRTHSSAASGLKLGQRLLRAWRCRETNGSSALPPRTPRTPTTMDPTQGRR